MGGFFGGGGGGALPFKYAFAYIAWTGANYVVSASAGTVAAVNVASASQLATGKSQVNFTAGTFTVGPAVFISSSPIDVSGNLNVLECTVDASGAFITVQNWQGPSGGGGVSGQDVGYYVYAIGA